MTHGITDLQLSLIVIGIVSVAGVWAYNVWQERKHRKAAQVLFGASRKDVLLDQPLSGEEISVSGVAVAEDKTPFHALSDSDERVEPVILDGTEALADAQGVGRIEEPNETDGSENGEHEEHEEHEKCEEQVGTSKSVELAGLTDVAGIEGAAGVIKRDGAVSQVPPPVDRPPLNPALSSDELPVLEAEAIVRSSPRLDTVAPVRPMVHEKTGLPEMCSVPEDASESIQEGGQESAPGLDLVDPIIDCVVQIHASEMISAPLLWAGQRQLFGRLAGRLCWSGFNENTGRWQRLHVHDPNSYQHLYAALQLADRSGPVGGDDVALFCDGVRQLASHYHAQVIVPVVSEVMARARSLDAFCASVDWRLVMHLAARGTSGHGLSIGEVGQMASVAGLQKNPVRDDGDLHALDSQGQTQFTLGLPPKESDKGTADAQEESEVAYLVLTLDVPRVADGVAAFDRMTYLARIMAERLDAELVDDRGKTLAQDVLEMIREKIAEFQQKMVAHQIPPGSRRALRLYS